MTLEKLRVVKIPQMELGYRKICNSALINTALKTDDDGTDLDVGGLVESVHLVEQLQQDSLHLPVSPGLSIEPAQQSNKHLKGLCHETNFFFKANNINILNRNFLYRR
jgi:hypothetical protein